jgi:two-component system phosphate regulon sensor histidine kinase PhoR
MVEIKKLATLMNQERNALLFEWRRQVRELPSARDIDLPTLIDHIPSLVDELVKQLNANVDQTIPEAHANQISEAHGLQRLQDSFDIEEVVAEYNILRGCIHDLADNNHINLQGKPFTIINRVFDHAIGSAVQAYATQRALEVQRRREEYLSFVAHDLRTPLTAISMAGRVLEAILPGQNVGDEASRMVKALRRNAQHLEKLVTKVLEENANLQTEIGIKLEMREFDLWPLVESLIHDLHPIAGTSSTSLINEVPEDLVAYADASLLRRIYQNLIANALNYTPRGQITIGAAETRDEDSVECWVSDNGVGIHAELLDKIFEKGESDQENLSGMGLGLAIVKTFTEAMGGHIKVTSKEGIGTTFRFSLPTRSHPREE